tara:strand:- start:398 stop:586 length:189 start_codon:yes stop_codon:yes gene_type:complete
MKTGHTQIVAINKERVMDSYDKLQKQCDDFFERNPEALERVRRALDEKVEKDLNKLESITSN